MTVKFKMVGKKIKKKNGKTFYFATAAPQGELDLAGLAKHMSLHNTPYSKGQIQGVLQDFVGCLSEILQNGYKVKLNELGTFKIGMSATQAARPAEFEASKNIRGFHLLCNTSPCKSAFRRALGTPQISQFPLYNVNRKKDQTPAAQPHNP